MNIEPQYAPIILIIALPVFSLMLGVVGYFLKDIRASINKSQEDQKGEIKELQNDLTKFKMTVAHQYVLKDDYIRTIASFDKKMDDVVDKISEINRSIIELLGKEAKTSGT